MNPYFLVFFLTPTLSLHYKTFSFTNYLRSSSYLCILFYLSKYSTETSLLLTGWTCSRTSLISNEMMLLCLGGIGSSKCAERVTGSEAYIHYSFTLTKTDFFKFCWFSCYLQHKRCLLELPMFSNMFSIHVSYI